MAAISALRLTSLTALYCLFLPFVRGDACGDPPGIVHGKVQIKSNANNVTAYYTCDQGFVNVGTEELICLSSGKWKKAKINCVPACHPPPVPPNAVIKGFRFSKPSLKYAQGNMVFYSCKPGYRRLAGRVFIECLGRRWTKVTFTCVASKKCRNPEVPTNGEKLGSDFSVGKRVRYLCDNGFDLHGAAVIECLTNRTWNERVPFCKVVDCGSLPDPVHGKKTKETRTTFGGKAVFICKRKRYSMIGSKSRVCQANGEWSGKTVVCKAPCSDPGIPSGGRRIGNNFRHGKKVRFRCHESLKIQGPRRMICYDGTWSDRIPKCLPPSQIIQSAVCGVKVALNEWLVVLQVSMECGPGRLACIDLRKRLEKSSFSVVQL
ncbi:CUB and sushi domain-containing protein 3 [Desmophyllum pertusum]|uniref:CUB and sushi domain-containing protein 3 n=1 Tax=Desmophyllum pertusum TaxID=174260 RepID=A0A9W9ZL27_9CNID|nr:CUB and sushi domain-containing protein 3 [Desmophyllum pertusum]